MNDEINANYVKIEGDTLIGNFATLAFDVDVTGELVDREESSAPAFRLFGTSPRGYRIEVGVMWARSKSTGEDGYMVTLHTGHGRWIARLTPIADRKGFYRVIPSDYLNGEHRP